MGFLNNMSEGRSMMQYGLTASESADSNPTGTPGSSDFLAMTSVAGHLMLNRVGRRSDLTLQVTGGGIIYDTNSSLDAGVAGLTIADQIQFRRWSLSFSDQLYYLPETPFGFSGGLLNGLGAGSFGGITSPNPFQFPTNTVLSLQNQQITESAAVEANITLSARSSWTVSANYGLTDYTRGGYLTSGGFSAGTGYNRQLSSRDTIGLSFTAAISNFGQGVTSLESYYATLNYGHRFSNHLAVQISGGGDDYGYLSPTGTGRSSSLTYTANGALSYLLGKTSLQIAATHQTSNGGGYLYGAIEDYASLSGSRQITRFWQLSGGGGWGKTSGLVNTPTGALSYQSEYGSASLARQVNPNVNFYFQIVVSHQSVGGSGCAPGIPCGNPFTQYLGSVGINWNFRARPLD